MVRILSIVWYKVLPARFGGQKGIAEFNEHLGRNFPVTCLCSNSNRPDLTISYNLIPELPNGPTQFISPSAWKIISQHTKQIKPTHLILEHPYHAIAGLKASKKYNTKLVIHSHNIEANRFKLLNKWWWRLLFVYEKWAHQKASFSFFKTESDMEFAIKHYHISSRKCCVLPYGIQRPKKTDQEALIRLRNQYAISPGEIVLLFAGTLDYKPNYEAIHAISEKLCPLLDSRDVKYRVLICGRNFDSQKKLHKKIFIVGEVEDLEAYYALAHVFINPVLKGAGIQTKNIDAIAHDCNLVSFQRLLDHTLIKCAPNKIFEVADGDWGMFADKIILAQTRTSPTPEEFFSFYDWQRIVRDAITCLENT